MSLKCTIKTAVESYRSAGHNKYENLNIHTTQEAQLSHDVSWTIHLWTVRERNDVRVATTLPLKVFTQRNFVTDFF